MAMTGSEKMAAMRKRRADQGLKELRGIWVTPAQEQQLKQKIKTWLKE